MQLHPMMAQTRSLKNRVVLFKPVAGLPSAGSKRRAYRRHHDHRRNV
jgi:hypothetical protein